jgi:hypothetical protein
LVCYFRFRVCGVFAATLVAHYVLKANGQAFAISSALGNPPASRVLGSEVCVRFRPQERTMIIVPALLTAALYPS